MQLPSFNYNLEKTGVHVQLSSFHYRKWAHMIGKFQEGLGTSSNNLLVPLLEVIQYVMRNK